MPVSTHIKHTKGEQGLPMGVRHVHMVIIVTSSGHLKMDKIPQIIEERLFGLEHIIHSIHHNVELLEFMSLNLHKERFNLFNNLGLHYIWGSLMGEVILDFYKLSNKNEKHSFQKTLNVSRDQKCDVNFDLIQSEIDKLVEQYKKLDFETVRSKYLAHQDLKVPVIKTELKSITEFKEKAFHIFQILTQEFKRVNVEFNSSVKDSFSEIFEAIDEYDEISGLLLANAIEGEEMVKISEIQEIIKKRERNAS
jgi:hypothetical protein